MNLLNVQSFFPPHIHPLTLVNDPDRLLAGEKVMQELAHRGFTIIQENDPVLLRHRVEELRPFSSENPVIILTTGVLEDLPYDLFQGAYRINLSLHQYFPNLTYPVLQTLFPDQMKTLKHTHSQSNLEPAQKTIDYLLREVFN